MGDQGSGGGCFQSGEMGDGFFLLPGILAPSPLLFHFGWCVSVSFSGYRGGRKQRGCVNWAVRELPVRWGHAYPLFNSKSWSFSKCPQLSGDFLFAPDIPLFESTFLPANFAGCSAGIWWSEIRLSSAPNICHQIHEGDKKSSPVISRAGNPRKTHARELWRGKKFDSPNQWIRFSPLLYGTKPRQRGDYADSTYTHD